MPATNYSFFDTDMFIHRLDPDTNVRDGALSLFATNRPSAMSEFSLVELKGNYIQDLILLRRYIFTSDSIVKVFNRIRYLPDRKFRLILAQLISHLGGLNFNPNPWKQARNQLLVHLDAQIESAWEEFTSVVDQTFNDLQCTRATEQPDDDGEQWHASIPECRPNNTRCKIVSFIERFNQELQLLVSAISSLDPADKTQELNKIQSIIEQTLRDGKFPWTGRTCRNVGDLLVALQSKSGIKLISSNFKEHQHLSVPLGYTFERFDSVSLRSS